MKLVHFSAEPVTELRAVEQTHYPMSGFAPKPRGLWVSDEDEYGWRQWCTDESSAMLGEHAYAITLADDHGLLVITDAAELDAFHREYGSDLDLSYWVDWPTVAESYRGIVITPYIAERRFSRVAWYHPWDCASGCIWDPAAIASITLTAEVPS